MSEEPVPYRAGPPANADPKVWQALDALQWAMAEREQAYMPPQHSFAGSPGDGTAVYRRTLVMPAGALVISEVHLTEHFYVITRGRLRVMIGDGSWEVLEAPYHGVTKPGTRRLLLIEEETEWTTYHATPLTDPVEIVRVITAPPTCPSPQQQQSCLSQEPPTGPTQQTRPGRLDHEPSGT
jgi:hypothetical protein